MKNNRLVVSQWRESSKLYCNYTTDEKRKWRDHYVGIYQDSILELDDETFTDLQ
jgi:hypothetical protein